jgi:hypothetical protein
MNGHSDLQRRIVSCNILSTAGGAPPATKMKIFLTYWVIKLCNAAVSEFHFFFFGRKTEKTTQKWPHIEYASTTFRLGLDAQNVHAHGANTITQLHPISFIITMTDNNQILTSKHFSSKIRNNVVMWVSSVVNQKVERMVKKSKRKQTVVAFEKSNSAAPINVKKIESIISSGGHSLADFSDFLQVLNTLSGAGSLTIQMKVLQSNRDLFKVELYL